MLKVPDMLEADPQKLQSDPAGSLIEAFDTVDSVLHDSPISSAACRHVTWELRGACANRAATRARGLLYFSQPIRLLRPAPCCHACVSMSSGRAVETLAQVSGSTAIAVMMQGRKLYVANARAPLLTTGRVRLA